LLKSLKNNFFIGIDNGTQGTKTIVVEGESGTIISKATKSYGLLDGLPPGHKEQDPSIWIEALHMTVKEALKDAKIDPKTVKAIGVSGQQHGFVPIDAFGKVIRPAKLWNDTSTSQECEYLEKILGGRSSVVKLIGNAILPGYTAPKILWLRRHEPENYAKLVTVLLPHDYLNFYLTGNKIMECGDASGTALLNVRTRTWSKKIIEAIDPDLEFKLPVIQESDKYVGKVKSDIAPLFGFSEDVLVSAGGGDNMMGAIGTGNTYKGIVTASLGTSGTIYAYSDAPAIDEEGEIAAFCDSTNAWLPLSCTMNVTVATELVRQVFNMSYDDLTKVTQLAPVGSGGLILLPYFEGERTPNIPDGTGVLYGLNSRTFNAPHICRAAMEGVTLGMNYGLNKMKKLGIEPTQIRLTGGGSRNKAWRQIAADVFNSDVVCLENEEGAAYGAALQAIWSFLNYLGEKTSIQDITDQHVRLDHETLTSPNQSNVEAYNQLQRIQDEISRGLRNSFKIHREFLNKNVS